MKKVKIILSLALCMLLFAALLSTAIAADSPVTLSLSPVTGQKGDTVTVDVTISEKSSVGDASLFVTFDPAKLQYVSSKGGSIEGGMVVTGIPKDESGKEIPGKVSVALAMDGTLQEKTVLAKITFKILDDTANIPLSMEIRTVSAYDAENNRTDLSESVKAEEGKIVIADPSDPKPSEKPTSNPTDNPTQKPTEAPTAAPTEKLTQAPTAKPTEKPTAKPTGKVTDASTERPTSAPSTAENAENPGTGDNMAIVAACSVLAVAAGAAVVLTRKKKGE